MVDTATVAHNNADDEMSVDAAAWTPDMTPSADPTPQSGRRPRMTYLPWARSQLVLMGATARDEHFWQCPYTGCRVWAGPYADPITAKKAVFRHVCTVHADRYFRSGW